MAALGTVGIIYGQGTKLTKAAQNSLAIMANPNRLIVCGDQRMSFGRKNTTDGNPLTPCLEFDWGGFFRFRWAFATGTHTLSIDVKNVSGLLPYPVVTIKANSECGITVDVVGTAIAGTGWQTVGPLTITPTSAGAAWVELSCALTANNPKTVRWDSLVTT